MNGWRIAAKEDDWIRVEPDEVQEAMFIRNDGWLAGPAWAIVGPFHRRAMPRLLRHAVKTL